MLTSQGLQARPFPHQFLRDVDMVLVGYSKNQISSFDIDMIDSAEFWACK